MRIVLVSTYELGRQPFGLASPAAWLRAEGHEVFCLDLAVGRLETAPVQAADLVAFHVPMHTATKLAVQALGRVREWNPKAHLCCYGLYAPVNEDFLRECGVGTILGGEFEQGLVDLARRLPDGANGAQSQPGISLERQMFRVPDRSDLPVLSSYAHLVWNGTKRWVGYTEASRGCKHLCRHCPIVPVYNGVFRIVQRDIVLADIRQQAAGGAEHITFGDPDFFNGPGHAVSLVEALHAEFPALTYDVTIKVEHLLKYREYLPALKRTGCLFVTSAVESMDDAVLAKLAKGHTRRDFVEAVRIMRETGLALSPTFVAFTPWISWESYREFLRLLVELDLVDHVAPIQLAIRLLIPAGSRLLELPEIREMVGAFDSRALVYPWKHSDASLDRLCYTIQGAIKNLDRSAAFRKVWELANSESLPDTFNLVSRAAVPYLNEPWYC